MDPPNPHPDPDPLPEHPAPLHSDPRESRASRPGRSRVPGRDHRRYYHERWRAEYLMEFNSARHGMLCLVCGSPLATLKLSTIKRHIRQKHPYSGAWGPREKQLVLSSWDSAAAAGPRSQGVADGGRASPSPSRPARGDVRGGGDDVTTQKTSAGAGESLRGWLRAELRLELERGGRGLRCLLCARPLPSLHLGDIRRHALGHAHPAHDDQSESAGAGGGGQSERAGSGESDQSERAQLGHAHPRELGRGCDAPRSRSPPRVGEGGGPPLGSCAPPPT